MDAKALCFFILLTQFSLNGCLGLVVKEDDSSGEITGKIIARTLLALPTIGFSEAKIARLKDEHEARPWMITSGSHVASPQPPTPPANVPFVVWGNHPAAVNRVMVLVQQGGNPIVERARLDAIFDEQKIRLMHSSEDMNALLRVGQMVGAGRVTFVEVEQRSETRSGTITTPGMIAPIGGIWIAAPPRSDNYSFTLHYVSVAVRTVKVDDGTIRWSGTASYDKPINNPEAAIGFLTEAAMRRAICPIEKGYEWIEQGPWRSKWGCKPPPQ